MSEQQENKAQNAFLNATPTLPSFSLPANLNNKLALNKKSSQEQRPRLSNLRSVWLSQQSLEEDAFAQDKYIDINLHSVTMDSIKTPLLINDITLLFTIATLLCFSQAIYSATTSGISLLTTASLGQWSLVMLWSLVDQYACYYYSLFFAVSACVFGIQNNRMIHMTSALLFFLVYRLFKHNQQLETYIHQQRQEQQAHDQKAIDQALEIYTKRRAMFLTTVSQEIRDAALIVMATLEQFSPSSILSNTHELLSACSIAVPITSISAINTMVQQACHISSHLNLISRIIRESDTHHVTAEENQVRSLVSRDFDAGELIQSVGDALAGMSGKLGVHFVIHHTDNVLYYPNVVGDEDGTKHALINLLRNMLEGCTPGACIELGLSVTPIPNTPKLKLVFQITHTASPVIPPGLSAALIPNANFTVRLLNFVGGKMTLEDLGKNKTRVDVMFELFPGSSHNDQHLLFIEKPSQILEKQLSQIRFSNEPTLDDLNGFIAKLKGVRMILHAPEKSIFAKHLTSCLASWNTDISHLPVLGYNTEEDEQISDTNTTIGSDSDASIASQQQQQPPKTPLDIHSVLSPSTSRSLNNNSSQSNKVPSPATAEEHIHSIPPAFVLIDDDLLTLERKLKEFRDKAPSPLLQQQQQQQQQPTPATPQPLASQTPLATPQRRHRRSKSRNNLGTDAMLHGTVAVVFFSSLSNYKRVRDVIHWFSTTHTPHSPRVVVVPKPAGPRRFLTALHTAWRNAVVEPQFMPIATSPLSPFVGPHHHLLFSPQPYQDAITPAAILTPHDPTRFSPGGRRPRIHSPSGLQVESEKGNYFFDPLAIRSNAVTQNHILPPKLNTSPRLSAVKNSPLMSATLPATTPSTAVGPNPPVSMHSPTAPANTNGKPQRRLRSHSNTFVPPTGRRTLIDLSLSPSSSQQVSPKLEEHIMSPNKNKKHGDMVMIEPYEGLPPPIVSPNPNFHGSPHLGSVDHVLSPKSTAELPQPENPKPKSKSKFNFKISNRKRKEKNTQPEKQSPPITVLIVEDNMINQAILSTWMKKHSIKFSVASDGKEAVEKWKGGGFHLILMDIQLPVMDGIEATKMIRSIEKERKIGVLPSTIEEEPEEPTRPTAPITLSSSSTSSTSSLIEQRVFQSPVIIVALTASSLESDRQSALAAGCNDFLTKPVSLEWLEKKIMEWGCMQALIDFEGWRKWKDKQNTPAHPYKRDPPKENHEREQLALRAKEMVNDQSRAIVLLGLNKKKDRSVNPRTKKLNDKRSVSDSVLSIPKQVEEREKKRQQQEDMLRLIQNSKEGEDEEDDEEEV